MSSTVTLSSTSGVLENLTNINEELPINSSLPSLIYIYINIWVSAPISKAPTDCRPKAFILSGWIRICGAQSIKASFIDQASRYELLIRK